MFVSNNPSPVDMNLTYIALLDIGFARRQVRFLEFMSSFPLAEENKADCFHLMMILLSSGC